MKSAAWQTFQHAQAAYIDPEAIRTRQTILCDELPVAEPDPKEIKRKERVEQTFAEFREEKKDRPPVPKKSKKQAALDRRREAHRVKMGAERSALLEDAPYPPERPEPVRAALRRAVRGSESATPKLAPARASPPTARKPTGLELMTPGKWLILLIWLVVMIASIVKKSS